jgi:nitrogenase subunit NifH
LPTRYTAGYVNDRKNLEQVRAFADRMGIRILDPIKRGTIFNTESADETSPDRIRPDQQAVEAYAPLGEEILA